jgi:hypothetical protein
LPVVVAGRGSGVDGDRLLRCLVYHVLDDVGEVHKGAIEHFAFGAGEQEQPVDESLMAGVDLQQCAAELPYLRYRGVAV